MEKAPKAPHFHSGHVVHRMHHRASSKVEGIPVDIAVRMENIGPEFPYQMQQLCIDARIGPAPLPEMPERNASLFKQWFQAVWKGII